MKLTHEQQDALTEIANIGAGKGAKHLSVLLQNTVNMSIPLVIIEQAGRLPDLLGMNPEDMVFGVRQRTSGVLDAKASFLFRPMDGIPLAKALVGSETSLLDVDLRGLDHDAITEIGNIIVSSFLSTLAELLDMNVSISVPVYVEDELSVMFPDETVDSPVQHDYVLIMKVRLHALQRDVAGDLILVLSQANLLSLLHKVYQWLAGLKGG